MCAAHCVLDEGGVHQGHARVRGNVDATTLPATLLAEDVTVASVLKDAGYKTGLIGKWGLGEPQKNAARAAEPAWIRLFLWLLKQGHAHNYYPDYLSRNVEGEVAERRLRRPGAQAQRFDKKVRVQPRLFAEEALKFVRDHKDQRFFLDLSFTIPHANDEAGDKGMEVPDLGEYAETRLARNRKRGMRQWSRAWMATSVDCLRC